MVKRDLGGEGKVFGKADACCTAGTAAPADIESVVGHLMMQLVVERRWDMTLMLGPKIRY